MRPLTNKLESMELEHSLGSMTYAIARASWLEFRKNNGYGISATDLLTAPGHNPKLAKNETPSYVLHLAPSTASSANTCAFSTEGCAAACLNTSGRGRFDTVQRGRIAKTEFLAAQPRAFLIMLEHEVSRAVRRHDGHALFRLNGTSDIRWERIAPFLFSIDGAEFYDYTKYPRRPNLPDNYVVTYSASERDSDAQLATRLGSFGYVAVVVDTPNNPRNQVPLPTLWNGARAHDGDTTDDWRDRPGYTLLRAKGDAVTDTSGFVRATHN